MIQQILYDKEKVDAWIASLRHLGRAHNVSHRSAMGEAIKVVRITTPGKDLTGYIINGRINISMKQAEMAGIPHEELLAIRTLIFG